MSEDDEQRKANLIESAEIILADPEERGDDIQFLKWAQPATKRPPPSGSQRLQIELVGPDDERFGPIFDRIRELRKLAFETCDQLGIPEARRPKFQGPQVLPALLDMPPFKAPPFDLTNYAESLKQMDAAWKTYRKAHLKQIKELSADPRLKKLMGLFRRLDRRAGEKIAPLEMRMKWAMERYCNEQEYPSILRNHGSGYTIDRVKKGVESMLDDLWLDDPLRSSQGRLTLVDSVEASS